MLQYFLYPSPLDYGQDSYIAKPARMRVEDIDYLARVIADSGLAASSSEVKSILERTCAIIQQHLSYGIAVRLGDICTLRPTIRGKFDSADDPFDRSRHKVDVTISVNKRLRKVVQRNARVERVTRNKPMPTLSQYRDVASDTLDTLFTPGRVGQINGCYLKFDRDDPEQGLFLASDELTDPIPLTILQKATDKEIVFENPDLDPSVTSVYFMLKTRPTPAGPLITGKSMPLEVAPLAVTSL
ncbi:MAG: DUF4469 domain-containing protein [Sedimentisphaerales bacterium]|nr:DUF4469 domain-containing protein [Sedimentisphaerales bacterium]